MLFNRNDSTVISDAQTLTLKCFLDKYKEKTKQSILEDVYKQHNKSKAAKEVLKTKATKASEFPEPVAAFVAEDGDKVEISKIGLSTIAEVTVKGSTKGSVQAAEKKATQQGDKTATRASRIKSLLEGCNTREEAESKRPTIKQTIIEEKYSDLNFSSEWYRLTKHLK